MEILLTEVTLTETETDYNILLTQLQLNHKVSERCSYADTAASYLVKKRTR